MGKTALRKGAAALLFAVLTALLLGAAGVLILNAACGALLPKEQPAQPAAAAPRQVPLRVVRGGRAA